MLVVPKSASLLLMDAIKDSLLQNLSLHLFVNNYSPDLNTGFGNLTEATFPGYSPISFAFTLPATINGANKAELVFFGSGTFTATGSSSDIAYGYYVVDDDDGSLLWAERFASAVPLNSPGLFVNIQPRLTGISEFTG
jgi:hypothetical protein